jgi:hypothetical protein
MINIEYEHRLKDKDSSSRIYGTRNDRYSEKVLGKKRRFVIGFVNLSGPLNESPLLPFTSIKEPVIPNEVRNLSSIIPDA